ncbi:hypothetical protein LguiB_002243 [Lonicera macranthoides]
MANSNLPRRIIKETQRLLSEPAPGISASPSEENMRYFNVMILGPSQSPYEGGVFKLELFLPEEYPMAAPKVRFLTKIYHPNIDKATWENMPRYSQRQMESSPPDPYSIAEHPSSS